ncbi:MAG: phenylalanine--tRNA ligase subunit alpha [Spirochaetales bacterium]
MGKELSGIIDSLHPLEVRVLRFFEPGATLKVDLLQKDLGFNIGQANQVFSWLLAKGLLEEVSRSSLRFFELTELGREWAEKGSPEERILNYVQRQGPATLPDIANALQMDPKDVGSAFGSLSKEGVVALNADKQVVVKDLSRAQKVGSLRKVLEQARQRGQLEEAVLNPEELSLVQGMSKKRGASDSPFKTVERDVVTYRLKPEVAPLQEEVKRRGLTGEEVGALTPEMLERKTWKQVTFRKYNIKAPPTRVIIGRTNAYCDFLRSVKDKLCSLGFEEFDGPLVETEFWNSDALFMPQFHSARDIHDVYYVKEPTHAKEIEQPYLDQVAASHEHGFTTGSRGWNYAFDRDFTRRLILRSQGTVLSAKQLPKAKVPGKYFGIVRCFRYDQVDATHLSDFYQTEGIVIGESVNLKTHLGFLRMFAEEIAGATEVKYVPGYFPFTEPSIEVHIKHPVLGWFELGGSGIFRPEVTEPLGVHVPVLAWGIGIDRMALMHLGLNDLRELFSYNIENVRLRRSK